MSGRDQRFCCLCLAKDGLFEPISAQENNYSIRNNIYECFLQRWEPINDDDGHVCLSCIYMLDRCANFIRKCLENNKILLHKKTKLLSEADSKDSPMLCSNSESSTSLYGSDDDLFLDDTQSEQSSEDWTPITFEPNCDSAFETTQQKQHPHLDERGKFVCSQCGRKLLTEERLQKHVQAIHDINNKKYKCSLCGKQYGSASGLIYHTELHKNERKNICWVCGVSCLSASALKIHMTKHDEKTIPCEVCNLKFSSQRYLRKHQVSHFGEKKHKCNICNKLFKRLETLKTHMVVHTGEKPFKCSMCDESFSFCSQRKAHIDKVHNVC